MSDRFFLVHQQARTRAAEACASAADGSEVVIKPPTRTSSQNALLHAVLQDIANKVEWAGKKRDTEVWKRLLVAAWLRARGESVEILPALDGHGVDVVFRRTASLTKAELSELLDFVYAWAAQEGVI